MFLNDFIIFIELAFNELVYNFNIRNILKLLTNLSAKILNLNYLRFIKPKKINDVIIFINVIIKNRYDNIYIIIKFEINIYLKLHYNYLIFEINFKFFN